MGSANEAMAVIVVISPQSVHVSNSRRKYGWDWLNFAGEFIFLFALERATEQRHGSMTVQCDKLTLPYKGQYSAPTQGLVRLQGGKASGVS